MTASAMSARIHASCLNSHASAPRVSSLLSAKVAHAAAAAEATSSHSLNTCHPSRMYSGGVGSVYAICRWGSDCDDCACQSSTERRDCAFCC